MFRLVVVHHLCADDTCRHSHDGVTHQHYYRRKHSAEKRRGSNVAVSNRRHCHDSPVDAGWYIGKWCVRQVAFHHVHQSTHADDHNYHKEEEDANLRGTDDDGTHQEVALLQEAEKLEHAEDTNEAECSNHHKVANRPEQPTDVKG